MENGFDLLEEKVKKAAELVRRLRKEKHELDADLGKARGRLAEAEKRLEALEKARGASADQAKEAEALGREVKVLRGEREEIRTRIGKLVELLEGLE